MSVGATIAYLIIAFVAAALASYALTLRNRSGKSAAPAVGSTLRIKASAGMYRSKLVSTDGNYWRISAPLCRNHYVPLRVGESLTIEAPAESGVFLFKTSIAMRDAEKHELVLLPPVRVSLTDRRAMKRCERDEAVKVDGQPGRLVDISPLGAKVKSAGRFARGERVRLDLPEGMMFAWVLDSWPTKHGEEWPEALRLRFEVSHDTACV